MAIVHGCGCYFVVPALFVLTLMFSFGFIISSVHCLMPSHLTYAAHDFTDGHRLWIWVMFGLLVGLRRYY